MIAANQALQQQLAELKQSQQQEKSALEGLLQQQGKTLEATDREQTSLVRQLNELQDKVATISGSDAKTWLLAQADFLVKMAGRKLWSDQDVTTAAALLKSADASLAEMNDPSLIDIRRAITEDVGTLSAVAQIDFDGIILKVNQLSNQVDDLRLADNNRDERPMDEDDGELSSSLSEWRQNLTKSWHNFMADFITVRRRDSSAEPLLAPNQDVYLRENIRSRLLVAAQAIPRHQNEVYKQSLETVSTWVRAYFDTTDPATKAFLEELDNLSQQSISMDVPGQLKSQPMLEKLMQTRVRNLLAQAPATHQEG
ncbi:HemX protein [Serratia fonticola AU-P3(3)]|nr:HemX protein [Serratia fonticola AU-P3(3)]